MKEHSSDKQNLVSSDSLQNSSAITTKKHWQSPKLQEMNLSETNLGGSSNLDGGAFS